MTSTDKLFGHHIIFWGLFSDTKTYPVHQWSLDIHINKNTTKATRLLNCGQH